MRGVVRAGSVVHLACHVGGGADSRVTATPQRSPQMFPERRIGPCTRYRSAESSPVATA